MAVGTGVPVVARSVLCVLAVCPFARRAPEATPLEAVAACQAVPGPVPAGDSVTAGTGIVRAAGQPSGPRRGCRSGSNTTCSYVSGISQTSSTSSLTTCDLVSQWRQFLGASAAIMPATDFGSLSIRG